MADSKLLQETRSSSYSGVFFVPSHCNCFNFINKFYKGKKKKKKTNNQQQKKPPKP